MAFQHLCMALSTACVAVPILSSTALAAHLAEAAKQIAEQIKLAKISRVLLAPCTGLDNEDARADFDKVLLSAFVAADLEVVDRQALRAALEEASLGASFDNDVLTEMAGGFGAQTMVVTTLSQGPAGITANVRAVSIGSGSVVASANAQFSASELDDATVEEGMTLQAQLRRLADQLARGLGLLEGDARYQTFAVLPFSEIGVTTHDKELGLLVSSEVATVLNRDHGLILVERSQLDKVIAELSLGQSGLVDPAKSAEVGKLAGAKALIMGTVSEAGDRYLVNAKVVSTGEGRVLLTENTALPAGDLVALSSEAVVLRTRGGALYRSLLLPGWGQLYNRQPIKGAAIAGAEVAALGAALAYHFIGQSKQDAYRKLPAGQPTQVYEARISEAESRYDMRNILLYVAIGIHALNIIDALVSGKTYDTAEVGGSSNVGRLMSPFAVDILGSH